jgi:cardiolipin synthase
VQASLQELLSYYGVFVVSGIVILLTLFHMLYIRRSPTSIIVWILLMVVAPYIFVFLYLLLGTRKNYTNIKKINVFHMPKDVLTKNELKIYTDADKLYTAFTQALREAKTSIKLATYVLKYDTTTQEIFSILQNKAKSGVKVELLVDSVGSFWLYLFRAPLKRLRRAGVAIYFFTPPFSFDFFTKFNLRYHRKIYLIDDAVLFSGGMNLSSEYMGKDGKDTQWIDLMYQAKGEIVQYYADILQADFAYVKKQTIRPLKADTTTNGSDALLPVASGPDIKGDMLLDMLLDNIYNAKESISILTPYFIPDEAILKALKIASNKGVAITIVMPSCSNHPIADLTRFSYLRELGEYNIKITLCKGRMIHAKAIVFDKKCAVLGSPNLDYRSLLLNYEAVTFTYNTKHILQLQSRIDSLANQASQKLEKASKPRRIFENSLRIFASQL